MSQRNQRLRLGGFANSKFVLINGEYWKFKGNRRCIQGQACLEEFRDILLEWFLQLLVTRRPMYRWTVDETTHRAPLEDKGLLEVLKFAETFVFPVHFPEGEVWQFQHDVRRVKDQRNKLTHEVRSWRIENFIELLNATRNASRFLVNCSDRANDLSSRVMDLITKCKEELKNIDLYPNLY
ncbi:uncharacterized protein LOC130695218 [Daphnia carinata]|uniref:uncharacterized protein LOC130695218 n=1 Tax=Daphnia carinata TaxID=120202 RepID=UPI00257DB043|nr:uncharacterized protein LOC130695218 [Daphnia carinata]